MSRFSDRQPWHSSCSTGIPKRLASFSSLAGSSLLAMKKVQAGQNRPQTAAVFLLSGAESIPSSIPGATQSGTGSRLRGVPVVFGMQQTDAGWLSRLRGLQEIQDLAVETGGHLQVEAV